MADWYVVSYGVLDGDEKSESQREKETDKLLLVSMASEVLLCCSVLGFLGLTSDVK
jgi:hypothetical protein